MNDKCSKMEQKGDEMLKALYEKSENCNLLTLPEAVAEFNLSYSTIDKISKECGAKLKVGRAVRIQKDVLQQYILNQAEK